MLFSRFIPLFKGDSAHFEGSGIPKIGEWNSENKRSGIPKIPCFQGEWNSE